jgi:NAD(P)-dependent dehydrogenase (short-subunit alcohol dehydrogenase family)
MRSDQCHREVSPDDIASAVLFAMTNTFMTGMTLRVDGGEPLI